MISCTYSTHLYPDLCLFERTFTQFCLSLFAYRRSVDERYSNATSNGLRSMCQMEVLSRSRPSLAFCIQTTTTCDVFFCDWACVFAAY